jgi:hypothetical protein
MIVWCRLVLRLPIVAAMHCSTNASRFSPNSRVCFSEFESVHIISIIQKIKLLVEINRLSSYPSQVKLESGSLSMVGVFLYCIFISYLVIEHIHSPVIEH